jgi:hypothetical protein
MSSTALRDRTRLAIFNHIAGVFLNDTPAGIHRLTPLLV